jgi:OFA family oxalate/formate antiporter-like MFS transporter
MGAGFLIASFVTKPFVFYIAHAAFIGAVGIILLMIYHALVGKLDKEQMPILQYVPMGIMASVVTAGVLLGNQYVGNLGEMDKLFLLYGTVGFLAGAGIGFAYVCPIAALVKWFPKQKGLVSGIAVAGFGFGAYIFSHKQFPLSAENYIKGHGITDLFLIHGIVCLVVVTLGALMLSNPPGTATKQPGQAADSNWQDTLRRPAFYVLWLMFFSGAMAGLMVIGILKPFAGSQLVEAATAGGAAISEDQTKALLGAGVEAVGWLAIFNAVGRVAWGFISDKIGRTIAFTAMFLFQAVMMFLLIQMDSTVSLAVGASIIGFNFGGNFALFPSATADLFGAKNLGANYGWVFTSYGIAGVVGIAAGNAAYRAYDSYAPAFMLAAGLCVLSAVLAIGLQYNIKRRQAQAANA